MLLPISMSRKTTVREVAQRFGLEHTREIQPLDAEGELRVVDDLHKHIKSLETRMKSVRQVNLGEYLDFYSCVLAATLSKLYDFCLWALETSGERGEHHWASAVLRGSTEEIILLSALRTMSSEDRNEMIRLRIDYELCSDAATQTRFFSAQERLQSVLPPLPDANQRMNTAHQGMDSIWKTYGMDGGRHALGNMGNLAQTTGLAEFYDYFYALTSRMVHFSPRILMRQGWGKKEDGVLRAEFHASNFDRYYTAYVRTYSCLLFRELVDRFAPDLALPVEFHDAAVQIHATIQEQRYPELVTYEEMNITPPNIVLRALETVLRPHDESAST